MQVLVLVLVLLSISTVFAQSKNITKDNPVVAEVNGKKIRQATLLRYHTKNLSVVRSSKKITLEESLNDLINRIIGLDKGKKAKIHKTPAVIKKINDVVYHAQISKDLSPKFKKIGKISDSEAFNYCKKNPEYRTSQILHRLRVNPSKKDVGDALEQSLKLYNILLKDPEEFAQIAKKASQTQNAKIGGDLGFQPRTRLSSEFYEAIAGKKIGYITKPFRTQYGIHLVKITDIKDCKNIDKNIYKKIVYDIKRDKIINNYFAKLRSKAKVKVYKDKM